VQDDSDKAKIVRPVRWDRLRSDEAELIIRERLADTNNVVWVKGHARQREKERSEITRVDAMAILSKGMVEGAPVRSEHDDGWKVVVVRRMAGRREAGAVTVIIDPPSTQLVVVTVEWMDVLR
jgi:hypothetical protein